MTMISQSPEYKRLPRYNLGEHYAWEVAKHKWQYDFQTTKGRSPTLEELNAWCTKYWTLHTHAQAVRFETCAICSEYLATCRLEGRNPAAEEYRAAMVAVKNKLSRFPIPRIPGT